MKRRILISLSLFAMLLIGFAIGLQFNKVNVTIYRVTPKYGQIQTDKVTVNPNPNKLQAGNAWYVHVTQQTPAVGEKEVMQALASSEDMANSALR